MNSTSSTIINIFDNLLDQRKKGSEKYGVCRYVLNCPYYSPDSPKCESPAISEECVVSQAIMAGFV